MIREARDEPFPSRNARVLGAYIRARGQGDFDAELDSHLAMHIEDGTRAGLPPEEARRQALIRLGGAEQTRQAYARARQAALD